MWPRYLGSALALALAFSCTSLCAQSSPFEGLPPFVDSVEYKVPGTLLNQWMEDSKRQDEALRVASQAVKTSQESFAQYKKRTVAELVVVSLGCLAAGLVVGHLVR